MKQNRQSTFAMALMTVAALVVTAWASSAVADPPAHGRSFQVFRTGNDSADHQRALIFVVKTRIAGDLGLVFVQTRGQTRGEGFVCALATTKPNDPTYECVQELAGNRREILTIGKIGSTFCENLMNDIKTAANSSQACKDKIYTSDKKNPVATPAECDQEFPGGECVCYDIRLDPGPNRCNRGALLAAPPNSGSGTGGHN